MIIQKDFLERHGETITLFTLFFVANLLVVFVIAIYSEQEFLSMAFRQQLDDISRIANLDLSGSIVFSQSLSTIIENNLKVMAFSFILSFLYGTGALFILSWNASILGLYMANFVRAGLFNELFNSTLGILPHAPIEILAYFLAGIAGGILSVGAIREKIMSKEFMLVFRDSLLLMAFAVLSVILGGYLEVYL